MYIKLKTFFSLHAWKHSLNIKTFLIHWTAVFGVIWTFIEFLGYFFIKDDDSLKPNVWLVLLVGLFISAWISRPRLLRSVHLSDKDITLQVDVNNIFEMKNGSLIIPSNSAFQHDYIDEGALIVQLRDLFFSDSQLFDEVISNALRSEPKENFKIRGKQVYKYPIGTVAQIPIPGPGGRVAYLLASTDLNEHGRGEPNFDHLKTALNLLWEYIGQQGDTKPLIIPILGSGRQRLTQNRLKIISLIVSTFLSSIKHRKYTNSLTLTILPRTYLQNMYNLDEIETYLSLADKFDA
ncbi:macro domain-containing protein [Mesobacillus jeotgali]|uniref:macro domain-containing protein n=1 Tax=Mesobacillus jeotgali TaxID=129985 RepID=UPI0009A8C49A|nr:macro domain-containing protein [Mesobacillus jeotgali]